MNTYPVAALLGDLRLWLRHRERNWKRESDRNWTEYFRIQAILRGQRRPPSQFETQRLQELLDRATFADYELTYGSWAAEARRLDAERWQQAGVLAAGKSLEHICPECGDTFTRPDFITGKLLCISCEARTGKQNPSGPNYRPPSSGHWEPASTDLAGMKHHMKVWNDNP